MKTPKTGLTTDATCVRIVDGDTIIVEVRRKFAVRMLDPDNYKNKTFGCAEKNTEEGKLAIKELSSLIKEGDELVLFVPSNNGSELMDINTFNRILGEIWTKDGINLSSYMKEKGYAKENQKED